LEIDGGMTGSLEAKSARQAALLIDVDNFADPQAIEAAWVGAHPDYFKLPNSGSAMNVRLLKKPEGFAPAC
jgi:hypothetical protein